MGEMQNNNFNIGVKNEKPQSKSLVNQALLQLKMSIRQMALKKVSRSSSELGKL